MLLGTVHLVASPHIPALLNGSPPIVYAHAVGPTLLNHVLVGILLLALGCTTLLAAGSRELWARRIVLVNAFTTLALPISIVAFMRRPEYYAAPLFVTGVTIAAVVSLAMLLAALSFARQTACSTVRQ